ncbi:MAG TPA: sigma-54-dependent Fis family transcriptional regulator [Methylococcaceae bacterium]|nr:sigma-54-dependent Fis family transcriptional regulator [Methylococcaceae bacterium]
MLTDDLVIAIVDPSDQGRALLTHLVTEAGFVCEPLSQPQDLGKLGKSSQLGLIVANVGDDASLLLAVFKRFHQAMLNCPVLVIVDDGAVAIAVNAIKSGAIDVISSPLIPEQFTERVEHCMIERHDANQFVCRNDQVRKLLALSERVAQTEVTVLLSGESGTGKEVLAHHIHRHSPRAHQDFVAVNCASMPESMLEDMLFGHEKGAFTGAHQRYLGLFEQASNGTLFLDEIGELPFSLQAKLLRVLQERELKRLGGSELIKVDVRVIAASNKNLAHEVKSRNFREDLYYRINVFPLKLIPLRERKDDIIPIAEALLAKHQQAPSGRYNLTPEVVDFLKSYPWPGNVRELENVMQRALVLATDSEISLPHILMDTAVEAPMTAPSSLSASTPSDPVIASENRDLSAVAWEREQQVILEILTKVQGSRKAAAEQLGISARTLRYKLAKIKDQGIAVP